jgi:DNA modification methylase
LQRMKEIESGSIDLTVTSPPYDNLRSYNGNNKGWGHHVWKPLMESLYRVTKSGGVVVWVVGDATVKGSETGTSFKHALHFMDVGFNLHDTMIYKREGPPLSHNRYEQKFEYMFILSKDRPATFNGLRIDSTYAGSSRKSTTMRQDGDGLSDRSARGIVAPTKLRGNVFEYPVGKNKSTNDKIAHGHPAIFPEKLANDHIISWSNAGEIIFDPLMGSGTVGKMAKLNNRRFIGIELDETYFNIAQARIDQA